MAADDVDAGFDGAGGGAGAGSAPPGPWPALPWAEWADTRETLHLISQVLGKVRLVRSPWINHSWSVPLYVSPRGLRTSLVPHDGTGFELELDLLGDRVTLETTAGEVASVPLGPTTMAEFHGAVMQMLDAAGVPVAIHTTPSEIADAVPLDVDEAPRGYRHDHAVALHDALVRSSAAMTRFRAGFLGKASPVHLFWGAFDLATTRFSGRTAPRHPGGMPNFPDDVAAEAYSHEVTSVGLWLGDRDAPAPVFYAYAYPTPDGFSDGPVLPGAATWVDELGEYVLPYEAVAASQDPTATLMEFFSSTHARAADLAGWDRASLECSDPQGPDWWATRRARET